eukprot:359224-Hanusia_phi.AAC.1
MKVLIQGGMGGYVSVTSQSRMQRIPTRTEGSKDCKLFHVSRSVMRKDLCQSEEKYELFLADLTKCGDDLERVSEQIALQSRTLERDNPDPRYPLTDLASQASSTKVEIGSLTTLINSLEETQRKNTKHLNKK